MKKILLLLCLLMTILLLSGCNQSKDTVVNSYEQATETNEPQTTMGTEPVTEEPTTDDAQQTSVVSRELDMNKINALDSSNTEFWFGKMADNGFPRVYTDPLKTKIEEFDGILFGDTTKQELILTFDCGYEYENLTDSILDTLKEKGVTAAFFVTMDYVKDNPDKVKRMIQEGHIVGNHSTTHPLFAEIPVEKMKSEIMTLHDYVAENFGYEMKYFRFPTGAFSEKALEVVRELGYRPVFWSFAYADWDTGNQKSPEEALSAVKAGLHKGAVVLLHAVSATNDKILGDYIEAAKGEGYQFIALP